MDPVQDARKPKYTPSQTKRLENRFASLAGTQARGSRTITKAVFCCQPEVSTNVFVGAYIDRLFEKKLPRGRGNDGDERDGGEGKGTKKPQRICDALTFEDFVHVFWVFSNSAPRSAKGEVLRTLLQPDKAGWVDRRSMFRFVKCMLPAAPDRALEGVVDAFIETLAAGEGKTKHSDRDTKKTSGVSIQRFLERGDLVDRLTFHM